MVKENPSDLYPHYYCSISKIPNPPKLIAPLCPKKPVFPRCCPEDVSLSVSMNIQEGLYHPSQWVLKRAGNGSMAGKKGAAVGTCPCSAKGKAAERKEGEFKRKNDETAEVAAGETAVGEGACGLGSLEL